MFGKSSLGSSQEKKTGIRRALVALALAGFRWGPLPWLRRWPRRLAPILAWPGGQARP